MGALRNPTDRHHLPGPMARAFGAPQFSTQHVAAVGTLGATPYHVAGHGTVVRPVRASAAVRIKAGGNVADTALGTGARSVRVRYVKLSDLSIAEAVLATAGASASAPTSDDVLYVLGVCVESVGTGEQNAGAITVETVAGVTVSITPAGVGGDCMGIAWVEPERIAYLRRLQAGASVASTFRLWKQTFAADGTPGPRVRLLVAHALLGLANEKYWEAVESLPARTLVWVDGVTAAAAEANVQFDLDVFETAA